MRTLLAIAKLTLREAFRSRLVLAVTLLLALIIGGMPPLLRGDNTLFGLTRMTLSYPLAAALGCLIFANLWIGSALISGDASARTLALTRVKPVRTWQIWLGKWLGLMSLNFALLLGCYGFTILQAWRHLSRSPAVAETMQRARLAVKPQLPGLEEQFQELLKANQHLATNPAELRALRQQLRRELPFLTAALQRGATWSWRFHLTAPPPANSPLWLRLRFDTDAFTRAIVQAECHLTGDTSGHAVAFTLDDFSSREFEVPLAATGFTNDTAFTLTMRHIGDDTTGPLILQPRQGLELLVSRTSLPHNALRALLIHLALLALLSAIGITCGTLFSLPVAAFCATGLLCAILISAFVVNDLDGEELAELPDHPTTVQRLQVAIANHTPRLLTAAARPALTPAPLSQLASATLIPQRDLCRALAINLLLLPLLCCILSALVLSRRELPA